MPIYAPPQIGSVAGLVVDADGFIQAGNGLPFKFVAEDLVADPTGALRRIKVMVKDAGVQKEVTRVDR